MASFDYDVVIIGSGFGGSVAALRAVEKGCRVGVMESRRRWKDETFPRASSICRTSLVPRGGAVQDPTRRRDALATPLRLPLPVAGYGGPD